LSLDCDCAIFKPYSREMVAPVQNLTNALVFRSGFRLMLVGALCLSALDARATLSTSQEAFWAQLVTLCGQSHEGRVTKYDAQSDQGWIEQELVIHIHTCNASQLEMALNVGENRSRTWVISKHPNHLSLKHRHRHEDGSEDSVSWYGGQSSDPGLSWRQAFAVDEYSKSIFYAEGLSPSVGNIWYLEIIAGKRLAYGLTRLNRHFRAEFDLTKTTTTPPPSWGEEE
jgi:hypothetical protein